VKLLEESKDGDVDKVNWGLVTDWSALGVDILIEHLDIHEKIKLLAAAMD